jgi:uncharacterized protein (DUF58 family)
MLRIHLKRWLFFMLIAASSLIIGLRTSVGFFMFFFWFITATAALNLVWLCIAWLFFAVEIRSSHQLRIDEDDLLKTRVMVANKGLLPVFNLVARFELPFAAPDARHKNLLIDFLLPFGTAEINYTDVCYKRGKYVFGACETYLFDPFGIFYFKRTHRYTSELYVYPRIFQIKKFPRLVKGNLPWFGVSAERSYGDEDDFYGIREYRFGDPLKTIHWMSSARHRKLIVKQFQRLSFFRATVIFNLEKDSNYGEGRESVCEYMIRIAGSVTKYLLDQKVSVEMIAHVGEIVHIPANKGAEHYEEILKFLTLAAPESEVGIGELIEEFFMYIPDDSNLVVIMLDKDWEQFLAAITVGKRSFSLIPIILQSSSFLETDPDPEAHARELREKLYRRFSFNPIVISRGDNLEDVFSELSP